jgi:hypothetical protein
MKSRRPQSSSRGAACGTENGVAEHIPPATPEPPPPDPAAARRHHRRRQAPLSDILLKLRWNSKDIYRLTGLPTRTQERLVASGGMPKPDGAIGHLRLRLWVPSTILAWLGSEQGGRR